MRKKENPIKALTLIYKRMQAFDWIYIVQNKRLNFQVIQFDQKVRNDLSVYFKSECIDTFLSRMPNKSEMATRS